jgi:hypothetical protein
LGVVTELTQLRAPVAHYGLDARVIEVQYPTGAEDFSSSPEVTDESWYHRKCSMKLRQSYTIVHLALACQTKPMDEQKPLKPNGPMSHLLQQSITVYFEKMCFV